MMFGIVFLTVVNAFAASSDERIYPTRRAAA